MIKNVRINNPKNYSIPVFTMIAKWQWSEEMETRWTSNSIRFSHQRAGAFTISADAVGRIQSG